MSRDLSIRAMIAAQLRHSISPNGSAYATPAEKTRYAVEQADALLDELERTAKPEPVPSPRGPQRITLDAPLPRGASLKLVMPADPPAPEFTPTPISTLLEVEEELAAVRAELALTRAARDAAMAMAWAPRHNVIRDGSGRCAPTCGLCEELAKERERIIEALLHTDPDQVLEWFGGPDGHAEFQPDKLRTALEPKP